MLNAKSEKRLRTQKIVLVDVTARSRLFYFMVKMV